MVQAFGQVIILVAIFLGFLLGLYALTRFLPGAWRERGQVFVFVAPLRKTSSVGSSCRP